MKPRLLNLFLTIAALMAALLPRPAQAQEAEVSFDFFYDSLRPYGEWIQVADYGLCWRPADTPQNWAPYTDGYWAYTDGGWTWVSYEDFGGIVYHYGRWANVEDEGWVWVPDYDWGPAWVSWRDNDEYVGWAPLPPEVRFRADVGVSTWVDATYDIGPEYYRFCRVRDFGAPVISEVILPPRENIVFVRDTVNITNITIVRDHGGFPFCGGPRFDFISRHVARPIPALKLVQQTNIVNINKNVVNNRVVFQGVQRGNTLVMPAPRVRRVANPMAALNIRPARVIPADRVNHGWRGIPTGERQTLRTKLETEVKGQRPETHPAKPVAAAELKPVPAKADPTAVVPGLNDRQGNRRPGPGRGGMAGPGGTPAAGAGATPAVPGARENRGPARGPGAAAGAAGGFHAPGTAPVRGPGASPAPGTADEGQAPNREVPGRAGGPQGKGKGKGAGAVGEPFTRENAPERAPGAARGRGPGAEAPMNPQPGTQSPETPARPEAGERPGRNRAPGVPAEAERPGRGPGLERGGERPGGFVPPANREGAPREQAVPTESPAAPGVRPNVKPGGKGRQGAAARPSDEAGEGARAHRQH